MKDFAFHRPKTLAEAVALVKAHPDASLAPVALMTALREGGKIDAAIELAHRALVRRSHDPFVLSELALAHLERDEIDTAEILVQEAIKADAKSAVAELNASQGEVGQICIQFHAAWETDAEKPADESGKDAATARGEKVDVNLTEKHHQIGALRDQVSVRYTK